MLQAQHLVEKLQKADKDKDSFLANTSHVLRNPLHGMLNIAQTALDSDRASLKNTNAQSMELLITVGRRMSFMLNNLLDLTRLKETAIQLQLESLQLRALASGVIEMLRFMTGGKPIQFANHIPDDFPHILADENRLTLILFNLLHNAVKFTHEGSITLGAELGEGKAVIRVKDTGIGMDEHTQRRIFQPYEQRDSSITAVGGGIGLGLSICKQLVELHGGTLNVHSVKGEGTEFTFSLPWADAHKQSKATDEISVPIVIPYNNVETAVTLEKGRNESSGNSGSKPPSPAEKANILAVDDDPVNLSVLVNVLSLAHYDIVTAHSGQEALSLLDTKQWDLIITDVMMPVMSGL